MERYDFRLFCYYADFYVNAPHKAFRRGRAAAESIILYW